MGQTTGKSRAKKTPSASTKKAGKASAKRCKGKTVSGVQCRNSTANANGWCGRCVTPSRAAALAERLAPKASAPADLYNAGPDPFARSDSALPAGARFDPRRADVRPVHPNDVIDTKRAMPDLSHLGDRVVTVDADGTIHDPWACCGHRGNFRTDKETGCTHLRQDTMAAIRQVCEETGARPVILSWRAGMDVTTREWLGDCALGDEMGAVFVPGGADDISQAYFAEMNAHKHKEGGWAGGQVVFKAATVRALQEVYGIEVVAAFDDNPKVIEALGGQLGVPDARIVPRLVTVEDHEWRAGYIGAPKPPERVPWAAKPPARAAGGHGGGPGGSGRQARLFDPVDDFSDDDWYNHRDRSSRHDSHDPGWDDPDEWWDDFDAPPVVEGDTVRAAAGPNRRPVEGVVADTADPYAIGVRDTKTGEVTYVAVEDLEVFVSDGAGWWPAIDEDWDRPEGT